MSNIKSAFDNKKAFIPFVTCGDPDIHTTEKIVYEMADNGADLIELGIPFSDPVAEGVTIQKASRRALDNGVTTDKIFEMVMRIRKNTNIPLVFMTYANIVFSYGSEKFISRASELNIDGIILPDVPYEESDEFSNICSNYNIDLISLIAPTSKERIANIAKQAKGFVYCVSSLGVTGIRQNITTDLKSIIAEIRANTNIPTAIGFGISTPEQAKNMAEIADGVIVGSAIVKICEEYKENSPKYIGRYVKEMKNALKFGWNYIKSQSHYNIIMLTLYSFRDSETTE